MAPHGASGVTAPFRIARASKEEVSSAKNDVYWYDRTSHGHGWLFTRVCAEPFCRAFITRRNRKRLECFDGCADRYRQGRVAAHAGAGKVLATGRGCYPLQSEGTGRPVARRGRAR